MRHVVFPMDYYDATADGDAWPIGERQDWSAKLLVVEITGTLDLVVEISPTGVDGTWVTALTLSVSAAGTTEKSTDTAGDWTINPDPEVYRYIRGRITGTPDATFELSLNGVWFNVNRQEHLALLTKEFRTFTDGLSRLVAEATADVERLLVGRQTGGRWPVISGTPYPYVNPLQDEYDAAAAEAQVLLADLTIPGIGSDVQAELIAQAEFLFQRDALRRRAGDPRAQETWLKMGRFAPGFGKALGVYLNQTKRVWRGR